MIIHKVKASCYLWPLAAAEVIAKRKWHLSADTGCCVNAFEIIQSIETTNLLAKDYKYTGLFAAAETGLIGYL